MIGERPECLHMDLFTEELRRRKQLGEDDILFVDGFLLLHSPEVRDLLDVKVSLLFLTLFFFVSLFFYWLLLKFTKDIPANI